MRSFARPLVNRATVRRSARPAALVLAVVFALLVSGINPAGGLRNLFQPDVAEAAVPTSATDETKVPHYFGPYPNWANSPQTLGGRDREDQPRHADAGVLRQPADRASSTPPTTPSRPASWVRCWSCSTTPSCRPAPSMTSRAGTRARPAEARPPRPATVPRAGTAAHRHAGEYTVVYASDELKVPTPTVGTGELETYPVTPPVAVQKDDVIGFYGQGIPVDTGAAANGDTLSTPASGDPTLTTNVAPAKDSTVKLGSSNYPDFSHDRSYSFAADVTPTIADPGTGAEATASVDPKTGAISGVTVTSPGAGYAVPPTVEITTAGVTPTAVATPPPRSPPA